ncbi:hypothetical protein PMSD_03790 [Paenibacillus macquariensis subsp. defensor]|nr:hypothetical protein PMSD_03790 [Paenibacillus macquariensis subsp. defensor]
MDNLEALLQKTKLMLPIQVFLRCIIWKLGYKKLSLCFRCKFFTMNNLEAWLQKLSLCFRYKFFYDV